MGEVVKMVEENCPQAFKQINETKYQILLDEVPLELFKNI